MLDVPATLAAGAAYRTTGCGSSVSGSCDAWAAAAKEGNPSKRLFSVPPHPPDAPPLLPIPLLSIGAEEEVERPVAAATATAEATAAAVEGSTELSADSTEAAVSPATTPASWLLGPSSPKPLFRATPEEIRGADLRRKAPWNALEAGR